LIIVITRVLIEGYKAYRVWYFLVNHYFTGKSVIGIFESSMIFIIVIGILDEIVLILIIISTVKCVSSFGKGLKEILIRQYEANEVTQVETTMF
jgi:hypothetical protein